LKDSNLPEREKEGEDSRRKKDSNRLGGRAKEEREEDNDINVESVPTAKRDA